MQPNYGPPTEMAMPADDLFYLTIGQASKLIRDKQLSPVELVEAHLQRIDDTDAHLNSFVTLLADRSLTEAGRAEAEIGSGNYRGPLHGIPIGLKDLYYTKGVRTTIGSKITKDFVPDYDAAVTEGFEEAGAVLLGKLQMHEFALGTTSEHSYQGPARNPWDTASVTGGSSGGSGSSVAAGQCMAALGTDTGGSVRIPSSLCGIVGLKPTFGRVSRYGVYPLSWSLDTVGPMTRSVEDCALVLNAIAGHDPRDLSSSRRPVEDFTLGLGRGVAGLRIGIHRDYFFDVIDDEVERAVLKAAGVLEEMGAVIDEVSIPLAGDSAFVLPLIVAEGADVHMEHLRDRADEIDPHVRARLLSGAFATATDYIRAQGARTVFNEQVSEVFESVDLILTPTTPIPTVKIGESMEPYGELGETGYNLLGRCTRQFNLSGSPTISVPCGFTEAGLPIGLQLAGRPFDETTVLQAAHAYEQATDWHTMRPPV